MSDLTPRQEAAVSRVTALILTNALMFQEVLSQNDKRVKALTTFNDPIVVMPDLAEHWRYILSEINYYPVFHLASELICCISQNWVVNDAVLKLVRIAERIVGWRAALRQDLMGRIYHRILEEAKYLGAYYTSIPAATLLLRLALRDDAWAVDWSDAEAIGNFRIADLACGTGTLLMAAADAVTDNHIRSCVRREERPDADALQRVLVERSIFGYDVLPAALHLTASTLALRVPHMPINATNLYSLPLGGPDHHLGSLGFLEQQTIPHVRDLYGAVATAERVVGGERPREEDVVVPRLHLCVMNPPFTRSVGGNLLFGNLPQDERRKMQARLKQILRDRNLDASVTAGLGSVFVALAHQRLEPGGRLALVLPRAVLSGVAWKKTRNLLANWYHLEYLVVCHEPGHWNFSENTNLSETLVVAQKRLSTNDDDRSVTCVNLWQRPRNSIESLTIARRLRRLQVPDVTQGQGALSLMENHRKFGEALAVPQARLGADSFQLGCAFAQGELVRVLFHLLEGRLYLPGFGVSGSIPLRPLGEMATLGPDRRDIHDGFTKSAGKTPYPALWGHDADDVVSMSHRINAYLEALPSAKPGRPLRKVTDLWPKASPLLLADRLRLNTMRVALVQLPRPALSNVWWPVSLRKPDEDLQKALAVWLNSTLGLLLLIGHRVETAGAWVEFKKPILASMPVLNISALRARQRRALVKAFDKLADAALQPFPAMAADPTRSAIDHAIAEALGLPDFSVLRELLAREPIVSQNLDTLLQ